MGTDLSRNRWGNEFSLYIHVPFCRSFCDYCDFYSVLLKEGALAPSPLVNAYIDALLADGEILLGEFPGCKVPTVYIGGGDPAALGADGISRLLGGLGALLPPDDSREFTLEANPESADRAFLLASREGGVNRLSLGVQSFNRASRALVHRGGDPELLERRLGLAAEIFPGAFSADLMAGLPRQNRDVLLDDIEKTLARKPAHLSLYALTVEEDTPLGRAVEQGLPAAALLPSPDEADAAWIAGRDALEKAGYGQYEVSNFRLPGKESRHNLRYWRMENWLGLGPAASGTLIDDRSGTGLRLSWPADLEGWLAQAPLRGKSRSGFLSGRDGWPPAEALDRLTLMKESILMGFRYLEGPGALFSRRFGLSLEEAIPRTLEKWRQRGRLAENRSALNREGILSLNPFLLDAFDELAKRPAG
ncbi:MAG: coproporphyrinogen III oxidase family protein [Treponema sp.]|nr:coproporphyrinogen III oxidase family protein [Treponema sp.]